MNEQLTLTDMLVNTYYDRNGRLTSCPDWVHEQRCGNCLYWQRLTKDEQPPEGWGVKGACGSHRGMGVHQTSQTGYCQDWRLKEWT